jgi:hypothetical protein
VPSAGQELAAAPTAAAITHLFATAADFVTPGDLLKAESIYTLGTLSDISA